MSSDLITKHNEGYFSVFGSPLLDIASGNASIVKDFNDKEYIDLLGGIAVNCLGHSNIELANTLFEQSKTLVHTSNFFTTKPQIELTNSVLEISNAPKGSRAFFTNSGTESLEGALKIVKKYGNDKFGASDYTILALTNSFHGRSLGALSITSKEVYRNPFEPLIPNVEFVESNNIEALENAFNDFKVAGLFIETVQGEAGVKALNKEFLTKARELTIDNEALLIVDEVQSGVGRTGQWFSYQNSNIVPNNFFPDVITLAKSLGGGFPIGGIVAFNNSEIGSINASEILVPGNHGTTFGGNPLACAAANKVIDIIKRDKLLTRVNELNTYIKSNFKNSNVVEIRGEGLLIAFQLPKDFSKEVSIESQKLGLIVNPVNPSSIRIAPAYNIEVEVLDKALEILSVAIDNVML
jgi:acetylornithine aminotransferase